MQNKTELLAPVLIAVACWVVALPLVWKVAVDTRSEAGLLPFFAAVGCLTLLFSLAIARLRRRSLQVAFYCACIVSVALAVLLPVIVVVLLVVGDALGTHKWVD